MGEHDDHAHVLGTKLLTLLKSSGFIQQRARGQRVFRCFTGEHSGKTFVMRRPDKSALQNLERLLLTPDPKSVQAPAASVKERGLAQLLKEKQRIVKCFFTGCEKYYSVPGDKDKPNLIVTCKEHRAFIPKVKVDDATCGTHGRLFPCPRCEEEIWLSQARGKQMQWADHLNRFLGTDLHSRWKKVTQQADITSVPPVGDWSAIDTQYDPEKYRHEINTALKYAKQVLKDFTSGQKSFEDLKQIVDIEIWQASKKYGESLNGALVYTIAKNVAGRFLKNQIEEQMVTVENPDGSIVLDDFGQPKKIPLFVSFEDKETDAEGKPKDLSIVEEVVSQQHPFDAPPQSSLTPLEPEQPGKAWVSDIILKMPQLEKLVSSWFGAKRAVGEALLENPECSVRDIPGVPKSTAARVRQAVLAEFRAIADAA